jgi:hypothetical protein
MMELRWVEGIKNKMSKTAGVFPEEKGNNVFIIIAKESMMLPRRPWTGSWMVGAQPRVATCSSEGR